MTVPLRFVVFDIDGTLIDQSGQCDSRLPSAIARLRRGGLLPILLTGRSLTGFRHCGLASALLSECDDAVLVNDGDVVFRRSLGDSMRRAVLPADLMRQVLYREGLKLVADDGTRLLASDRHAATAYAMAYQLPRSAIVAGVGSLKPESVVRVTIFGAVPGGVDAPGVTVRRLRHLGATVLRPRGGGKARRLADHLGSSFGEPDLARVAAFGDGDNDAKLLAACGLGVAVPGSSPRARAAAQVRIDTSLASYLETFDPPVESVCRPADA